MATTGDWVPDACTLPTADRPLRVAEFDDLFGHVTRLTRTGPSRLALELPGDLEALARDLARRESQCCSFFDFRFETRDDVVVMHIDVPADRTAVLDTIDHRVAGVAR